ncbi:MAG TPA: fasciclin domain-containing protein [Candidatus Limnocylindrales bacterium]|jgi:uncharacterized surface protein with fasciclin (FAS1) repeats|nr:fasciclin domain-containing protein [Candidatus Limnocylindrales bacterium]
MKNKLFAMIALFTMAAAALFAVAKNPMVGGQEMFPSKNIIQNAVNSADHTTLVAAVKAAGLVETLEGPGPFTVFAPTNEAFNKLPGGTVDTLLKPENKETLTKVLTYHVIAGKLSAADLKKLIKAGNGAAELKTVEGGKLWATLDEGKHIMLKDEKGGAALVTIPDVFQSNGVIHVIDAVVMPN